MGFNIRSIAPRMLLVDNFFLQYVIKISFSFIFMFLKLFNVTNHPMLMLILCDVTFPDKARTPKLKITKSVVGFRL